MRERRSLLLIPISALLVACGGADESAFDAAAQIDLSTPDLALSLDDAASGPACEPFSPRVPLVVSVLPDAGETPLVSVLSGATASIRLMVYEMGAGGILDTLKAKAMAGVSVEVILDVSEKNVNQKYFDQLVAAGAQVKWSDPKFTYTHAKFFVVDDVAALVSTGNFSKKYSIDVERNYAAHDTDPQDVAQLAALFDADWNGTATDLSCTRLIVSPENSRSRILSIIESATTSLDIESMQFADSDVRAAVVSRKNAGVTVRVILADAGWIAANREGAAYLASNGIAARYMTAPHVHVKSILVDGVRAYIGSENLSATSLDENREVGLGVEQADAMTTIRATFENDYGVATAF